MISSQFPFAWVMSMAFADVPTLLACLILTFVLTVLVFVLAVPHERKGSRGGLRAFLNFDQLLIAPIFKFVYLLLAIGMIVFSIGGFVGFCVQVAHNGLVAYMDAGQWALLVIGVLLTLFICEVLLRIGFEVSLLMVKLFENVAAIKAGLEISRSEEGPRADSFEAGPAAPQTPQAPQVPTPGPADGGWWQEEQAAPACWAPPATAERTAAWPSYAQARPEEPQAGFGYASERTAVMQPSAERTSAMPVAPEDDEAARTWDCPCGARGNTGNFCGSCGRPCPDGDR